VKLKYTISGDIINQHINDIYYMLIYRGKTKNAR